MLSPFALGVRQPQPSHAVTLPNGFARKTARNGQAMFNVVARNQDDHVKNVSFTMDRTGAWSLSPAYDLTWAYAPGNPWLNSHQMSLNGKRDDFTREDIEAAARNAGLVRGRAGRILEEVRDVVATWPERAEANAIDPDMVSAIAASHRLTL